MVIAFFSFFADNVLNAKCGDVEIRVVCLSGSAWAFDLYKQGMGRAKRTQRNGYSSPVPSSSSAALSVIIIVSESTLSGTDSIDLGLLKADCWIQ